MSRSLVAVLALVLSLHRLDAGQWRSSGPEGGAVRVLAAAPSDPRVVYFTSGSVLHRSTDLGITWSALNGPFPQIVTFAIDPQDAHTVLVVSGSGQLYKTINGGETWAAIGGTPSAPAFPTSIVIDPRDSNVVYLARDCGPYFEPFFNAAGVFKSVDGGATFTVAMNGMQAFQRCVSGLTIDPVTPDTLYALPQYTDNGYARTDDGARTWMTVSTLVPSRVIGDPRDAQKRYGTSNGSLVASADAGHTWFKVQPTALETGSPLPAGSASALTIDESSGRLFLAGAQGVYRSGDGGRSVLSLGGEAREGTRGVVFDEASGVLIIGTDTGVYRSNAFPWNAWTRLRTGDSALSMRDVKPSRLETATMYAASTRRVFVTRDHGATWTPLGNTLPGFDLEALSIVSIAVDAADTVFAIGYSGSRNVLYKLVAGSQDWVPLTTPLSRFEKVVADPGTPSVMYLIIGNGPAFIATRDGGVTWSNHFTPTGDASSLAIDPRDGAVFYAGTRSSLFKTYNGGHTWIDVLPNRMITDVQISPADPDTIVAIGNEYGTKYSRIHVSHDAGVTWTSRYAAGEVVSMTLDPRDRATVITTLTDGAVYRTRNDGLHWIAITGNLPSESIRVAFSRDGSVLHAATTKRGIWELSQSSRRRAVQ
jgi:photosystem II stability/assembly factor-like uncharacterized protein